MTDINIEIFNNLEIIDIKWHIYLNAIRILQDIDTTQSLESFVKNKKIIILGNEDNFIITFLFNSAGYSPYYVCFKNNKIVKCLLMEANCDSYARKEYQNCLYYKKANIFLNINLKNND